MLIFPPIPKNIFAFTGNKDPFDRWDITIRKAENISNSAHKSMSMEALEIALYQQIMIDNLDNVLKITKKRSGLRALTNLWLTNPKCRERTLNAEMLRHIDEHHQSIGLLSMNNLTTLFYTVFYRLDKDVFNYMADILKRQVMARFEEKEPNGASLLHQIYKNIDWMFDISAPDHLIALTVKNQLDLDEQIKRLHLHDIPEGLFLATCAAKYYIENLKTIPLGANHSLLREILKPDVHSIRHSESKNIGHAALEIIVDRSGKEPTPQWQNFVLDLAGDPRIAHTAENYRRWWKPLGQSRIDAVTAWLAKEDLKLFLKAIEEHGKKSFNLDLMRMFPARKKFLEGLYEHGFVRNARLMLGRSALNSVTKILGKQMSTSFIKLGDMPDKSVIYLDCGSFHIIEGSHTFKLWIYLDLPSPRLSNYGTKELKHLDLTLGIPNDYRRKNYGIKPLIDITHSQKWQKNAIDFLTENGVELDLEKLLSSYDFRNYIDRYGIPVARKQSQEAALYMNQYGQERSFDQMKSTHPGELSKKIIPDISADKSFSQSSLAHQDESLSAKNPPANTSTSSAFAQKDHRSLSQPAKDILAAIDRIGSCSMASLVREINEGKKHINHYLYGELKGLIEKTEFGFFRIIQQESDQGLNDYVQKIRKQFALNQPEAEYKESLSDQARMIINVINRVGQCNMHALQEKTRLSQKRIQHHLNNDLKDIVQKNVFDFFYIAHPDYKG